jgi:hypothetical protein
MKTLSPRKLIVASVLAVVILLVIGLVVQPNQSASGNPVLSLQAPSFIGIAQAEGAAPTAVSAIVDEAGISAYFQAPVSITISSVASLFRTVEFSNTDYIIGSIAAPNYPEDFDVHVYAHRDGWVLAYYPKTDPASKIVDWKSYNGVTINTTMLKNVLVIVADAIGSPSPNPTYYDFRSPNANNLMFIAEKDEGAGNQFTVQLPSSFSYYERSWSLYSTDGCYGKIELNGTTISTTCGPVVYGTLTASQLPPDTTHTIAVRTHGGLALVYRIP